MFGLLDRCHDKAHGMRMRTLSILWRWRSRVKAMEIC